ncbi:hypothetical protein Acr_25g0001940 [Actinidia rufa]|uniref:Integrase catalytic domain-containing protein n=1 Tax=Actinidia rufa TaxID=165716 RepID=A0A7J0GY78_9ERIC|nr:hypothetical protein Acr_25g0001940 [Actinidia rufa]
MAEQMRIMNENNGRLMQLLFAANPPLPAAPPVPDIERSRHSIHSRDRSQNVSIDRVRGRRRAPSPSLRERSPLQNLVKREPGQTNRSAIHGKGIKGTDLFEVQAPYSARHLEVSNVPAVPCHFSSVPIVLRAVPCLAHLLNGCSDEVMCKAFFATLKGPARSWLRKLSPGTVDSFGELSRLFVANFMSCINRQKNASHLFTVHQKETESLKDFVKRFNKAVLEVEDPSDKVSKADKYITAEELAEAKRRRRGKDDHKRKEPDMRRTDYREETRYKRPDRDPKRSSDRRPRTPPRRPEGYLRKYVAARPPPNSPERRYGDNRPTAGDIRTIHGGFGSGGYSTSSRKRHARNAHRPAEEEIYNLSSSLVADQTPITFSNDDLRGLHLPHDDALVISAVIANFNIQRILIDNGSSADILFISAFERMKIGIDKLHPFHTPLIGLGGNTTHPLEWINLPITLGTEPHQTTVWQDFIVVDCPSLYNAILGRPTLGGIKAITSTYHLKLKFPTLTGIGEIKGDQKVARQCFISAMRIETSSIQALTAMSSPRNIQEVQQLTGRIAALNRFVSKSVDKCLPFFKILRKSQTFQWNEESENAFQQLKEYLGFSPLLTVPTTGEDLYIYLSISPTAVTTVLIREEDQVQRPIYYVSKVLMGAEAKYPKIEKLAYALMIAARKLRHYFQAHPMIVLTDQPLKHILQRPDTSGRLLKWSIELRLVIQIPSGEQMEYAIRMGFKATNNEAEYEALFAWLRVVVELGAQSLEIFSDSQLVINQVQGDYLAKDARMMAYLGEVKAASAKIKEFKISQIPREDNKKADALANLASTFEFISNRCIPLELLASPSIGVANQILQTEENLTWMDEIIAYLQRGILPKDKLQARRLQYRSASTLFADSKIPKVIISGNARQFDNDKFRLFCSDLAISHHFSSSGHPQANGQVEVTNRTILRNLKARLERSNSEWAEDLPSVLWAYHTTSRIPTGETPYSMVFDTESVIPVEIGMPNFKASNFNKESNEVELRLNLYLLKERKEKAELRQAAYKCQVTKYYNQRVKHRSFLPGDLVLRRVTLSTKEPNAGKLGPTWEGPYKVVKVSRPGTYWLEDPNERALSHPWNA